jgi:pimeloyl-ACP methyl ester carboxylesterase
MAFIERDGVKLHYEVHGSGPTILLTHGFGASSRMWTGQIETLAKDFQLILWDLRGHGRSDYPRTPEACSQEAALADMAALLDVVNARSAVIGGLSLGGYLSLAFHRLHPERTRGLLIIDTGPGYRSGEAREAWNQNALKTAARFEARGIEALKPREMQADHRDATGLAVAARGLFMQRDAAVIDSLPSINIPALIVVGADDEPFLAPANYMAAKIPGAKSATIPHAGHFANLDNAAAFNAAVANFLRESGLATQSMG